MVERGGDSRPQGERGARARGGGETGVLGAGRGGGGALRCTHVSNFGAKLGVCWAKERSSNKKKLNFKSETF